MALTARDPAPFLPLTPAAFHVLLSLAEGDKHGYAILKEIVDRTDGAVELSTGTLYTMIKRFLADGLVLEARSRPGDDERRRRYRLTDLGRAVAVAEAERHAALVATARARHLLRSER